MNGRSKITVQLPEIKLVGITARTNNANECNVESGKVGPCVQSYFQNALMTKILHRKKPGTTLCAYTNYESDWTGDYTFFIGEEVTSFDDLAEGLETHTIAPQVYTKFTTEPGQMPNVCIQEWIKIWQMTPEDLGGERRYSTDFEVYDERAADPQNVVLDIYVGIKE